MVTGCELWVTGSKLATRTATTPLKLTTGHFHLLSGIGNLVYLLKFVHRILSMKYLVISILILSIVGCKTDFSVNGEYEERAVVHFLLDQGQEYHFLKLNKTFLGDGNANDFAMIADSSDFNNVDAVVEEFKNGSVIRSWTLQDTIIENKNPGAFYHPNQKLYFFYANDLDEEALYRLKIDVENGKHIITGQTELVKEVSINVPSQITQIGFAEANVPLNGYRSQQIRFTKGTGAIFNAQMDFSYVEQTASGNELKTINWNLSDISAAEITTTTGNISAQGEFFYQLVRDNVPVADASIIRRYVQSFEVRVTAGSEDLYTYMLVNQPTSSIAQNKPEYSNVDGAIGIFSSRVTVTLFKTAFLPPNTRALSTNSTRELCEGQYTYDRGFCSPIPNDNPYSFYCP